MTDSEKPTILIVEDDLVNLHALVALLSPHYQLLVAKNGEEALRRVACADPLPDLVLLDIMLPGMNGYQFCQTLKQNSRMVTVPVIFLTSITDVAGETRAFETGGVDFIQKPFHESIVLARVKTHIELKRRGDLLEQLSTRDPLTKLCNRRRFDQFLEFEWYRAARHHHSLTVILMDIDHFKLYNDHYGHPAGDACLIRVAQAAAQVMKRKVDFLGRYGGEEFVCVLPECRGEAGIALGERIRQNVEARAIPHEASLVADTVTMSVGVASIFPTPDMTPVLLVEMADEALYQAKKEGRNRVVLFSKNPSGEEGME
ncbi:MAG: diguanylate cyclase [Magnetococcales bacterium]|nr:diguanylate cyclase [Magnetococcales bacterium]